MAIPVNSYPAASTPYLGHVEVAEDTHAKAKLVKQFLHTHLVVLQHGLWGSISDSENVDAVLRSRFGTSARVIRCDVNGIAGILKRYLHYLRKRCVVHDN